MVSPPLYTQGLEGWPAHCHLQASVQLDAPEHRGARDKLEGSQRSEVPESLRKASPAEEADESSCERVAWLKHSTGCGKGHNCRQGFQQSKQAEEGVARESCGGIVLCGQEGPGHLQTPWPLHKAPLPTGSNGFPRQTVLCGPVGVGVLITPGCLKLSHGGSSSGPGAFACSPAWREGMHHLQVPDRAYRFRSPPPPFPPHLLPSSPTPSFKPLFSDHRPLPSPPGY